MSPQQLSLGKRIAAAAAFQTTGHLGLLMPRAALAAVSLTPVPVLTRLTSWSAEIVSALGGLGFVIQRGRLAVTNRHCDRIHNRINHLGMTAAGCALIRAAAGVAHALTR